MSYAQCTGWYEESFANILSSKGFIDSNLSLHGIPTSKAPAISPIILPLEKAEALLPSGLGLDIDGDVEDAEDVRPAVNEDKPFTEQVQTVKENGKQHGESMVPAVPIVTEARKKDKEQGGMQKGSTVGQIVTSITGITGGTGAAPVTPAVPNSPAPEKSAPAPTPQLPIPAIVTGKGKKGKIKQQPVPTPVVASLIVNPAATTPATTHSPLASLKQPSDSLSSAPAVNKKHDATARAFIIPTPVVEKVSATPKITNKATSMGPPPPPATASGTTTKAPGFKTMRIVSSTAPSAAPASNTSIPSAIPIQPAKKIPVLNLNLNLRPGTPANRDDLFSDTASTTSSARAMSPTPSGLNSPRVVTLKPKSKSALKKERQMAQREREAELAAAAAAVATKVDVGSGGQQGKHQEGGAEEHAPVVARQTKKRDKKKKNQTGQVGESALATATGTPGSSRPESPMPVQATPVPQTPRNQPQQVPQQQQQQQLQQLQAQQQSQQLQQLQHEPSTANPAEENSGKPPTTNLTAAQILHELAISGEINFLELELLKPIVGLNHKFDISQPEIHAYDRHINGTPTLAGSLGATTASKREIEQLRAQIVSRSNIILRGFTKEQEEKFSVLEEKVLAGRKNPYRWTPPPKQHSVASGGSGRYPTDIGLRDELSDVSSWWKDAKRISAALAPADKERLTSAIAAAVGLAADQALSVSAATGGSTAADNHHYHHHHHHPHGHHYHHHHHHDHGYGGHIHGHHTHQGQFTGDGEDGEDVNVLVSSGVGDFEGNDTRDATTGGASLSSGAAPRITVEALNCLSSLFPQGFVPPFTGEYKVSVDFTPGCGGVNCQGRTAQGIVEGVIEGVEGVEGEYEFVVGGGEAEGLGVGVGGTITLSAGLTADSAAQGGRHVVPEITISSSSAAATTAGGGGSGKSKQKDNGKEKDKQSHSHNYPHGHTHATGSGGGAGNFNTVNVPLPANLANTMNGVISGMIGGLGLPGFGGLGGAMMGMGMLGVPGLAGLAGLTGGPGSSSTAGGGLPGLVASGSRTGMGGAGAHIQTQAHAHGVLDVSVEEAEKQLVMKRKETEGFERKLNQLLKRNRRLAGL